MSAAERATLGATVAATKARAGRASLSVALGAGAVLATVGLLTTSGYLISRAAQHPEILALSVAIVGVRFFGIARALLRYAERLVSHDLAFRALSDLRSLFFRRLIPLVPSGLGGIDRSELLSRFVGDVDRLQDLYLRALSPPLVALIAGSISVLVAALILPAAGVVLALGLLAGGTLAPVATRMSARSAGRRQGPARAALGGDLVTIASGSAELAVAGRGGDWVARADRASNRLQRLQRRDAVSAGLAAGLLTAIAAATVVAVLAVAIPAVHGGAVSGVLLAALALLTMGAFEAVAPLGDAAASIDACASAAARVQGVLEREPPLPEPDRPAAAPPGPLELRDVRFRYEEDGPWILDGADLTLAQGRAIALVGPSGAGKSTVAELAVRFRDPDAGFVGIGGAGHPQIGGHGVREAVRLCSQDAYLFTTTLRENVALGRGDAGDAEILTALRSVGLGPWVASLPRGLETEVGEAGARVSGGQRQRIAAARSLLAEARFLVFDEPTAHLDPAGAADLLEHLARLARRGPGVLVVTHESRALDAFDEVLELREGAICPCRRLSRPPSR